MKNVYNMPAIPNYTAVVAAYMRYSSTNQNECSIEYQRNAILAYAISKGYYLKYEFIDMAMTGTNDRRPGFQQMIEEARSNPEWSKLLIFNSSRFSRNTKDTFNYIGELEDNGIEFVSVTENFDMTTGDGRFQLTMLSGLNQYYSTNLANHVFAGQKLKAQDASHCGGKPPLGYDVVNKKLVINEAEAKIVKMIFDMYEHNFSYRQMAKKLNEKGIVNKSGKPFVVNSFYSILRQEKYTGTYVWNKASKKNSKGRRNQHKHKPVEEQIRIDDAVPPIISREQFDRVQKLLEGKKRGTSSSKSRHYYLLSGGGFLRCGECGSYMVGSIVKSHGRGYKYYYCPNHKGKDHTCPNKGISAEQLEPFVIKALVSDIYRRDDLITLYNSDNNRAEIRQLIHQITGLEKSSKNLIKAICMTENSEASADMRAELEEIGKRKQILKAELDRMQIENQKGSATEDDRKKICCDIRTLIKNSDSFEVKKYLRETIKEISVSNTGVTVVLNIA